MECNEQCEWENLLSFGTSSAEMPRKVRPMDWETDEFDCSFATSAYGGSSGLAHAFSKRSNSTSISSSSPELRPLNFTSEELGSSEEFGKRINTSPSLELSFGSSDPVLGLNLGKRTYFEDFWEVGSALPVSLVSSSASPVKRTKSVSHKLQTPRCQVEGCNIDLSSAKDYHRKHRICENHSKFPKVVVSGLERRFCQQCSRFHCLSEFDEKKRSCRRRLSDHNARRRKPNPGRTYDGKQQMDFLWNRFALIHPRSEEKFLWPNPMPKLFSKEKVTIFSSMGASQNLDGALSLLSNSTSWVPSDQPTRFSLDPHPTTNLQQVAHRSGIQLSSVPGYWQPDPPVVKGPSGLHTNGVGQFSENYFSLNQFNN